MLFCFFAVAVANARKTTALTEFLWFFFLNFGSASLVERNGQRPLRKRRRK